MQLGSGGGSGGAMHETIIRYPRDIAIDLNHWLYHQDKHVGIDTWW